MTTDTEYDIGDVVELRAAFTDTANTPANPSSIALRILAPNGTIYTPTPSNPSTGVYTHLLQPDQSGWWAYRFTGTGANAAAEEGRIFVRTPLVPLTGGDTP
jgi:hypothetical protein